MDLKIAPPATRDEFRSMKWGIQSDDDAVKRELYEIYRQGNNPKAEFWGPSGYDLRLRG